MDFLNFKDRLEEYRYSFGLVEKATAALKVVGTAAANGAILTGKVIAEVARQKDRTEKRFKNHHK